MSFVAVTDYFLELVGIYNSDVSLCYSSSFTIVDGRAVGSNGSSIICYFFPFDMVCVEKVAIFLVVGDFFSSVFSYSVFFLGFVIASVNLTVCNKLEDFNGLVVLPSCVSLFLAFDDRSLL